MRQRYLDWVEEQVEAYKESISRDELLSLADGVVGDIRMNQKGQYQLTEVLLCDAVDQRIFELLQLPSYRVWRQRLRAGETLFGAPPSDDLPDAVSK